jgi:protein ImuA
VFVIPAHVLRQFGRLSGHGFVSLGFDCRRAILVDTPRRQDTVWALVEALRSQAPQAVVGMVDRLDLKTSQRLHLAADDAGLPLLLLRPWQNLESSAAATRWRVGAAIAARDRFGSYAHARWHLQLERCRNGRPGEWVVEYDHVAHCFSLVAALADLSLSRGAGDQSRRQAHRS